MNGKWQRLLAFFKEPSPFLLGFTWALTVVGIVGSLRFVFTGYTGVFSYAVYAVAALSLAYTTYTLVRFAPTLKNRIRAGLNRHTFTRKLTENYSFRTLVFAGCSFVINLGFVVFNTVLSILTGNGWYGSLAGYYFLLSLLRGGVFWKNRRAQECAKDEREKRLLQLKNYRLCGIVLFALDLTMAVPVTLMVLSQKPTQYTEIMAIVFAAYTFYKIFLAIWNIFKARKTQDVQIQSFRNISLADAAISLLSLQTTLIATFSTEGQNMLVLNAMTGAFVCLMTIGLGVWMIIRANEKIKEEKYAGEI